MPLRKAEIDRRMKRFVEGCRQAGMKLTHQRTEIFRELASTGEHPDAERLYQRVRERIPAISRDTVYRTLSSLEDKGLLSKVGVRSGRTRYDANADRHHHFVCIHCGRIEDFYSEALDDLPVPKAAASLGSVLSTHVQLRGVCSTCARRGTRQTRRG